MKQQTLYEHSRQQGIALPTTMILLFLAALAGLYAAKTSMKEQMVTADHYRSEQAFATAQAGVEAALKTHNDYSPQFDAGGNILSSGADVNSDTTNFSKGSYTAMFCDIWDDDGNDVKSAKLMKDFLEDTLICKNLIDPDHPKNTTHTDADGFRNDRRVGILSVGKPDDNSGRRTISIVSAPAFVTDGPPISLQPLVARIFSAQGGTVQVINRYSNATIWAGNSALDHGNVKTYINDGVEPVATSRQELTNTVNPADPSIGLDFFDAMQGSGQKIGANSDILDNDYNLVELTDAEMFEGFFSASKSNIENRVEKYTDIGQIEDGQSGLIWLDPGEGNSLSGSLGSLGDCSSETLDPVMLIVETRAGDLDLNGGSFICGVVFVFGDVSTTGTPTISGAMITTGSFKGTGTVTIVYDPEAMKEPEEGFANSRGVDAGTWKDWAVN